MRPVEKCWCGAFENGWLVHARGCNGPATGPSFEQLIGVVPTCPSCHGETRIKGEKCEICKGVPQ